MKQEIRTPKSHQVVTKWPPRGSQVDCIVLYHPPGAHHARSLLEALSWVDLAPRPSLRGTTESPQRGPRPGPSLVTRKQRWLRGGSPFATLPSGMTLFAPVAKLPGSVVIPSLGLREHIRAYLGSITSCGNLHPASHSCPHPYLVSV